MADTLTDEQAKAFLNSDFTPAQTQPSLATNQAVADLAASGANKTVSPLNRALTAQETGDAAYIARNQVGNIPLDIESGASPWVRFNLSFKREQENQIRYLQGKYGEGSVRKDDKGDLIVRVLDKETGKPKDVLVDEKGMTAKDFLDMAGSIPEIAGGILAMRAGRASGALGPLKGVAGGLRDVATTALGAEGAGVAKDVQADISDQRPDIEHHFLQILKDRAQMAEKDVIMGGLLTPAQKAMQFMRAPLNGSRGPVQFDLLGAKDYFKSKYGVDIPLSVGESTGSPLFSRTEAYIEKLPGGSGPIRELKTEQENQLRRLQKIIMGSPGTDEEVGTQAISALRSKVVGQVGSEVGLSREGLAGSASSNIESAVSSATKPGSEWNSIGDVGNSIRSRVTELRDLASSRSKDLYAKVKELGGDQKIFPTQGLAKDAQGILDKLPSKEITTETASPILDEFGNTIKQSSTGSEVMKEFVPPNVVARLKTLADLGDQNLSLSELTQMRREVYDDIAKGQAVPGLGTHYLSQIGKSLTGAIEEGVKGMPSGDLKTALQAANQHYKGAVIPFNRTGIAELFRESDQPGYLGDTELVKRYFQGPKAPENLAVLKDTLGASSPEYARLKRVAADSVIETSRDLSTGLYDAKTLLSNLNGFVRENPAMAKEVFGSKVQDLADKALYLKVAQGGKLDQSQLEQLLAGKGYTADRLRQFVEAQKQQDILYKNSTLKGVASGDTLESIKPSEFVNRFVDSAEPSEVRQVLGMLHDQPETVNAIRQKTVEKIFRDAARPAQAADINTLLGGEKTQLMSGTGIFDQLKNPTTREKLQAILGKDTFNDVVQYMNVEAGREAKEQSFKSAGGIAAGAQIAGMMRGGDIAYLGIALKNFMAATMLSSKPIRSWLSAIPASEAGNPALISSIVSSPAFIRAVTSEFGKNSDGAMARIKGWIDNKAAKQSNQPQNSDDTFKQFLSQP